MNVVARSPMLGANHKQRLAALHTLEKRLETIARNDGQQIPADTFGVE